MCWRTSERSDGKEGARRHDQSRECSEHRFWHNEAHGPAPRWCSWLKLDRECRPVVDLCLEAG